MAWTKYYGVWEHWWENTDVMIWVCVDYPSAVSEKERKTVFKKYLSVNPNISNGKFKCSFSTAKDGRIEISLYSIDGRRVKNLFDNYVKKGSHYFYPDITGVPQGVYFIRMKSKDFTRTKKIVLVE